jgi:cytochrome c peroxidase
MITTVKIILLTLLIIACAETTAEVFLPKESETDPQLLRGKKLFQDKSLSASGELSCETCHPYGNVDRRQWNVGLSNGLGGTRTWDTQTLWGIKDSGPYMWGGELSSLKELTRHVVDEVMGGGVTTPISESDLEDLTAYVESFPMPQSPFLNTDGTMTDLQKEGKRIFEDPARGNCTPCHFGEILADKKVWNVGNNSNATTFAVETPSLLGMWDTFPYWHTGGMATIRDVLDKHSWIAGPNRVISPALTEEEKVALEAYLNSL